MNGFEIDWEKSIILSVLVFVLLEVFLNLGGKLPWGGILPGDTMIQIGKSAFFVPLATSILFSVVISLIFLLIDYFRD